MPTSAMPLDCTVQKALNRRHLPHPTTSFDSAPLTVRRCSPMPNSRRAVTGRRTLNADHLRFTERRCAVNQPRRRHAEHHPTRRSGGLHPLRQPHLLTIAV